MKGPIYIHRYTMRSRAALNAASTRHDHEGALIKVGDGYGCMHPWPELGDVGLDALIQILKDGGTTPTIRSALFCAREDGKARVEGRNLFDGLSVPRSNATLAMDEADFDTAVASGFTIAKVKMGRDLEAESKFIMEQAEKYPALRWRLDFNATLGRGGIENALRGLSAEFREKIDFLEDPCVYDAKGWQELHTRFGIPLAVDRDVDLATKGFSVAILKPAVNVIRPVLERAHLESWRVVFTSYLDHPLGQCFAAWRAAQSANDYPGMIDTCGLVTHGLFEPDPFIERMGEVKPDFSPPSGHGLGFDDLLESLPWKKLI
ncbi:hypothetical protein NT6N_33910 [Oceaniferula spumae]|uniref:Mandelate racemase/muconate lactonizing enzyme C-terminal domain-containing protein n=1 Tax=Oceaniferula spumae TaxID=2979115 RepID=A0AAT9FQQ0_9BACT